LNLALTQAAGVGAGLATKVRRTGPREGPRIYPKSRKFLELTRETAIYTKLPANRRNSAPHGTLFFRRHHASRRSPLQPACP
jgi:hypothetical protein